MRQALPSGNPFAARSTFSTRLLAMAGAAMLGACSTLGNGGDPAVGDVTGDQADEVNWSFAHNSKMIEELRALKEENAKLRFKLAVFEEAQAQAAREVAEQAAASAASHARAPTAEDDDGFLATRRVPQAQGAVEAVVAAAQADKALGEVLLPAAPSPRLVQPSFADDRPVFANEAPSGAIALSSVLFGVHLASYRDLDEAREGWRKLQRENPDELGLLEPRIEQVIVPGRGAFLRLIGGGFSSQGKASSLCRRLKARGIYCAPASFGGERLTFADLGR